MKSLKKLSLRPIVIVLTLATALSVAAKCDEGGTACAATAATASTISPPEPITDGSYRDDSYEQGEAPPEPIEDGSYRDGSQDDGQAPPEPITDGSYRDGSEDSDAQDDASGC
ncbi:hypothetical protein ACIBCT_37445 [Streptosporangium sp. NPDC050855]|uniref:hypothetical protein n=1 Tax=Streptosporangium sp. NPDC050855 TaxID=3366194 RepID=UPI00378D50BC